MKLFKLITIISFIVLLSACGRNADRVPYKGYPKTYPSTDSKSIKTPIIPNNKK